MSTTNTDKYPPIALDGLEAKRLTFKHGEFTYIYDARGYQFARCPTTGDIRTEPEENRLSSCDTGIFFGAYDDGWPRYFAFYEADCFDPPQYLICARSFEDAYDIFLDEFASIPDDDDVEELIDDLLEDLATRCMAERSINPTQVSVKEWLAELKEGNISEYEALRNSATEELGNGGQVSWAPNGARVGTTGEWSHLRWSESIQGHELKLVKIELVEER